MEENYAREYRVWCESGDLMACAKVFKRRAWWTVELEPFYYADRTKPKGFRSQEAAYKYAAECADEYMTQCQEWERNNHELEGCCVPSEEDMQRWQESYWIQISSND